METLTAELTLKRDILVTENQIEGRRLEISNLTTAEEIKEAWSQFCDEDENWDSYGFSEGKEETEIETPWSRNYETKSVAYQLSDGSWIGWTHWYGGGKYGNPEEINWIKDAYFLKCSEEQKMVTVRTFSQAE